ncbi:male sterility protein-domain-containing protein, partial [Polychytrium aggregatum]|uniref:male sterility protein-domain-containing protein n=1 Tax=Polychytrium aggregatum TaxID=110093 RepID=UPI0022FE1542
PECLCVWTNENDAQERHSYQDVWQRAYSVLQVLKSLPGWDDPANDVVALHVEPELYWVVYTYAVWMSGKKVVNFALGWSAAIRNAIAESLNIKFILYSKVRPGPIAGVTAHSVESFPVLDAASIPAPSMDLFGPLPELAMVVCTSGTTGIPKIINIPHRLGASAVGSWNYQSRAILQSPSFMATVIQILAFGTYNGSLWFPKSSPSIIDKANEIVRMLDAGCSTVTLSPSFMKAMIQYALSKNKDACWLQVTLVALSGEMVPADLVAQTRKIFPAAVSLNIYGSSESGTISAIARSEIPPGLPAPRTLVYTMNKPGVRCTVVDENGDEITTPYPRRGILCYVISKDDPLAKHPNFVYAPRGNKLASFGHFPDGSPRVCTMDEAELLNSSNQFTIFGRTGRKVKINGVYADLEVLENLLLTHLDKAIKECCIVQTSDEKIVLLYVPVRRSASGPEFDSRQILDMAQRIFALENIVSIPINNCLDLYEMPLNDSAKRDLKRLKRIAEQADYYGLAITYPPIPANDSSESRIAIKVSALGAEILEIEAFNGRNYYISGAGFNSLSVVQLSIALRAEFDIEISPLILLSHGMNPVGVARIITEHRLKRPFDPPVVNLAEEAAKLDDPTVTAEGLAPFEFQAAPRSVLLTGATGFLGSFLLFELANQFPSATIVCLVRAASDEEALKRLKDAVHDRVLGARQQLGNDRYRIWDRVRVCSGDLGRSRWGLSDEAWDQLARDTDVIVHNGSEVHWMYSYERLRNTNVLGTATALKLATTHHLKPVHYVSTVGAIPLQAYRGERLKERIYEEWTVSGGYGQTKWVAEQLIDKAHARGVPATILRPTVIIGDSIFGVSNTDDYIWRYVRGCIQVGANPSHASHVHMNLCPVDYVAKAIATVAASKEALDLFVFHLDDISNFAEHDLFDLVQKLGWKLFFQTRDQFRNQIVQLNNPKTNVLYPLMDFITSMSFDLDNEHFHTLVPQAAPDPTKVVTKCLEYLALVGYLPEPEGGLPTRTRSIEYPEMEAFGRTDRA